MGVAMAFSRLKYDSCDYRQTLMQNSGVLEWTLDPMRYVNQNRCRHQLGLQGGTNVSHVSGNLVDLESTLKGIDRDASRCPSMQYAPRDDNKTHGAVVYRTHCPAVIDTTPLHLPECQFIAHQAVPGPATPSPYKCERAQ